MTEICLHFYARIIPGRLGAGSRLAFRQKGKNPELAVLPAGDHGRVREPFHCRDSVLVEV